MAGRGAACEGNVNDTYGYDMLISKFPQLVICMSMCNIYIFVCICVYDASSLVIVSSERRGKGYFFFCFCFPLNNIL